MKSLLDKDFKYTPASKTSEPNYLREKFKAIREQQNPVSIIKPLVRAKLK